MEMDPPGNDTLQEHIGAICTSTLVPTASLGRMPKDTPKNKMSLPLFANRTAFTDWLVAFKGSPTSGVPVLQQAVDILSSPEYYRCLIESILANHDWIVDIARNSAKKGQGFLKLVITTVSALSLRLHVYVPGGTFDNVYHEHRWNLASKVVYGTLTQYLGTVKRGRDDSFDDINSQQCSVRLFTRDGPKLSWTDVGTATIMCTGVFTKHQGSSYYLQHESIHMIPNLSQVHQDYAGTVTMLLHGPHVKEHAATFWPLDTVFALPEHNELQSLEVEDVEQVFRLLLNLPESGTEVIRFVENRYYMQAQI